jgi:hypothetical protein
LSNDGSIHDTFTTYTWATAFAKITALNGSGGFANHTDWRLPNVNELQSLANYDGAANPAVSPAFDTGCVLACTVLTCSCTQPFYYWTSSTSQQSPNAAWAVYFVDGGVGGVVKTGIAYVRAVRSGS